jgi:hypothetical protein
MIVECLTLMKEAVRSVETSVVLCQSTQCNILEDFNIYQYYCEQLHTALIYSLFGNIKIYFRVSSGTDWKETVRGKILTF